VTPGRRVGQIVTTVGLVALGILFGLAPGTAYILVLVAGAVCSVLFLARALWRHQQPKS